MIPWIIAILAAAGFGLLAVRAGRSWTGWAIGGGLLGLVATILVLGLADARFIPYSSADGARHDFWSLAVAVLVVLVIGWLATMDLHQHHQVLRRWCGGLCSRQPAAPDQPSAPPPGKAH